MTFPKVRWNLLDLVVEFFYKNAYYVYIYRTTAFYGSLAKCCQSKSGIV